MKGYRELSKTFKAMGKDVQKEVTKRLKEVGEPARRTAEQLAGENLSRLGDWSQMRLGVTSKMVYIAPRQRSKRIASKRPKLAVELLTKAMFPAIDEHEAEIMSALDDTLDELTRSEGF